ncbi:efflux RND transporter periplasmic adaptor subunit [Patescibacteria group bacterium]|nr:efflux RND transporter periplasmic adaptor subunit [Patescibacteria group bacterium]
MKKIFLAIVIVGVIGIVIWAVKFREPVGPEYVTEIVEIGTLTQSVEATGKVESMERIDLNFRTSGRISEMNVNVGNEVKKGQILARLESRALLSRVSDAQAQVDKEKADYDKLLAGSSDQGIQVSEDTVTQKQQDVSAAENALANLRVKRKTEQDNLKEKAITVLNNEVLVSELAIEVIDNTLDDPDANSSYAYITSDKNAAQLSRDNANNKITSVDVVVDVLTVNSSDTDVLAGLDDGKLMLDSVKDALSDAMIVLKTADTTYSFTESDIDTLKSNIQTKQTTVNTSQTNIVTAKTNWTDKIAYYNDQVANAEDAVAQVQSALRVAQSQLELEKSPPRDFEINAQKAKISQAEAALNLALANLEEAVIRSPLNGTITKKYYEAGEQTSLSSPVLEMIGQATLEIEVDISESDIAKVIVAQDAQITLDAFGDEKVYIGSVTFVDPAETLISDVVYYKVKVAFSDSGQVKPGMTANVTIVTDSKENVLFVPFRAVKSRNGDKYVEVFINGQAVERDVVVGLRGDEGIEIISGIEAGDEVITFIKEK